jgi:hypothetical protein
MRSNFDTKWFQIAVVHERAAIGARERAIGSPDGSKEMAEAFDVPCAMPRFSRARNHPFRGLAKESDTRTQSRCGALGQQAGRRLGHGGRLRRGEAVHDCGCFPSISGVELAQDVRDVDAGSADADDERRGDLAVGEAAGDEG